MLVVAMVCVLEHILNLRKNGAFTHLSKLSANDRSSAAVEKVNKAIDTTQASIDNLPYSDNSHETVTCLEVIEHFPLETYKKTISELYRVEKSTIVIAVPYKEDIKNSLITCPSCHTKFNQDFHMRSFDEEKMSSLFDKKMRN
uniref:class I SAM-dependent methyltransferase n=1 Tax=Candidatus Electronema sp. TaxID=2698783 RepID=UPI004055E0C1